MGMQDFAKMRSPFFFGFISPSTNVYTTRLDSVGLKRQAHDESCGCEIRIFS